MRCASLRMEAAALRRMVASSSTVINLFMRGVLAQQYLMLGLDESTAANKLFVITGYKLRIAKGVIAY